MKNGLIILSLKDILLTENLYEDEIDALKSAISILEKLQRNMESENMVYCPQLAPIKNV